MGTVDVLQVEHDGAPVVVAAADLEQKSSNLAYLRRFGLSPEASERRHRRGIFVRQPGGRVAFAYPGLGSQRRSMLAAVLAGSESAASTAAMVGAMFGRGPTATAIDRWLGGRELPARDPLSVQALVLAADLAAHAALEAEALTPDVVTGHSYGDYAAMVAAGVWTVGEALHATVARSAAIRSERVRGGMIALETTLSTARTLMVDGATVANVNGPTQVVASGSLPALEAVADRAEELGIRVRRLAVPAPFHSPAMAPVADRLRGALRGLRPPRLPFLSSVTGRFESEPSRLADAIVDQLLRPVDLVAQVAVLKAAGVAVVVEIGPRAVLTSLLPKIDRSLVAVAVDDPARPWSHTLARVRAALASVR